MTKEETKDLVLFMKEQKVYKFKVDDVEVEFSGAAFMTEDILDDVRTKKTQMQEEDDLLFAST